MKRFYNTYKAIAPPNIPIPNAPRMKTISLPSSPASPSLLWFPETDELYPLILHSACLSSTHRSKLETIILTAPIHLRTPSAHIGTLYSDVPGQTLSALDAVAILKTLASSDTTPSRLPRTLPTTVEISHTQRTRRCRESPVNDAQIPLTGGWLYRYIFGCGPLSEDSSIWGFEVCDLGGNSVIHVA
ncbi:hypothetical protein Agabi119p4_8612 [Agaricus bisporus var. burnettii]|uniref:Uncharacterized protein n=1 Tax=Agaricus bisporus var. burnettii TaxID=192524 RepID=A0A8H7C6J7_AGABI|nr:hypothetical protein Agabi119p4_8612 [Agaricus bisporus var. burnettii]